MEARMQSLTLPQWPLYGLEVAEQPGYISGVGVGPGGVCSIRLDYRRPIDRERLIVQTTHTDAIELEAVFSALDDDEGQPLPLGDPAAGADGALTQIVVEGVAVDARIRHSGTATAWALTLGDVTVLVVAANTALTDPQIRRIDNLKPLKRMRSEIVQGKRQSRYER